MMFARFLSIRPIMAAAALVILGLGAMVAVPQAAEARVFVGIGVGPAYYPAPYYYYPPPYYYAPPPVVYAPPPPVVAAPPVIAQPTSEPYTSSNGQTCREYQSTVTVNGQQQPSHGTACLQPDGSWRIVN